MYERNAIILERYFDKMFGYDMKNNIKTNFKDYCELIENLENYKKISEEEDNIIQEYDSIANKIREIQKKQEALDSKNSKYQEARADIFQNIDENYNSLLKKVNNTNSDIQSINEQIEENAKLYIQTVNEFNEKSSIRMECGKQRRIIEEKYNDKLDETLDNYQNISIEKEKQAKQFANIDAKEIEKELKEKINKNGEKEKVPFNNEVITKAIKISIDIQKKETEVLVNVYEKTNKLFSEIKNNSTKMERHKKTIKDAKSKIMFISAFKEYLIQFLDNERLTCVNGEDEHNKLMKEACKNIEEDLKQIDNLYTLLLKEINKKVAKKSYDELYNINYLTSLEKKSEEFEFEVRRLRLPVTIINPNYWRIEGMQRIYDVFYNCVTQNYERDLSKYNLSSQNEKLNKNNEEEKVKINKSLKNNEEKEEIEDKNSKEETIDNKKQKIDKKIDLILGRNSREEIDDEYESDYEDEDELEEEDISEEFDEDMEEIDEMDEDIEDLDEELDDWGEDDLDDYDFDDEDEIDEDIDEKKEKSKNNNKEEVEEEEEEIDYDWGDDEDEDEVDFFGDEIEEADDDEAEEEEVKLEKKQVNKLSKRNNKKEEEIEEDVYDEEEEDEKDEKDDEEDELVKNEKSRMKSLNFFRKIEEEKNKKMWSDEIEENDYMYGREDKEEEREEKKVPANYSKADDWGNEFINIDDKSKKKGGIFGRFKKQD